MLNNYPKTFIALTIVSLLVLAALFPVACMQPGNDSIPNLSGEWKGINRTVSDQKGYLEWEKTVTISEQQDRRFKGHFDYSEGTIKFSGVIFMDNMSFAWVSEKSQGYNIGKILGDNKISSCYIESGKQATAGCAELIREPNP